MSGSVARRGALLGAAALALLLVGCGGEGSPSLPTSLPTALPTDLASALPTALPELPTELPSVRPPEPTGGQEAEPEPTSAAEQPAADAPVPPRPTAQPTEESAPTEQGPAAPTAAAPATTAPPAAAPAPAPAESTGSTALWWLLGFLLVAAVVVIWVAVARRRKAASAWDARFTELVTESAWLAHQLVPRTLSASTARSRRTTWVAYRPRVDALGVGLIGTADAAPQDRRATADRLRTAVFDLATAMDTHTAAVDGSASALRVEMAQIHLEAALRTAQGGRDGEPVAPAGDRGAHRPG